MKLSAKWIKTHKSLAFVALFSVVIVLFLAWLAFLDFPAINQASVQEKTTFSGILAQMEFTLLGFSFFLLGFIITQKLNATSSTSKDTFYTRLMILISLLLLLTMVTAYMSISYIALKTDLLFDATLFLVFLEGAPMILAVIYMIYKLR